MKTYDALNRKEIPVNTRTTISKTPKALLAVASMLLALLAATVAPAAADAPVITTTTINVPNPAPSDFSCPSFNVLVTLTLQRRDINFYEDGALVLQQRHIDFEGMLYNATTGYSVPYDGNWNRTQDFVENNVTMTGKRFRVQIAGQGVMALDVGRTELDLSYNPPQVIFAAGQHEFVTQLCQALDQ